MLQIPNGYSGGLIFSTTLPEAVLIFQLQLLIRLDFLVSQE